ncbi:MAG: ABC transporter ATP-binding protein [Alphaproteobacteria bacterium]|nr:ABC transporter ATP-binding protein [Alphaproteobacteria bacterium]
MALLEVRDLSVRIEGAAGAGLAVRDLSLEVDKGATLGIVGESGCGKSMTALAIMGLLPDNAATSGRILFEGTDLLAVGEERLCEIRGNRIAMVFQEPMTSLNPVQPIGRQVSEALRLHRGLGRAAARSEAVALLDRVGIPQPARRIDHYPHQLSGGQRQRAMLAMALSCGPDLLIADEPTTALDVTIQKQILDLLRGLIEDFGMGLILISHDLGVVAESVERIIVMYGGAAVERGATATIFRDLAHPYSQGLFNAVPRLGRSSGTGRPARLASIRGTVPELKDLPEGCTFADRCELASDACRGAPPPPVEIAPGHTAACIHVERARRRWRTAP